MVYVSVSTRPRQKTWSLRLESNQLCVVYEATAFPVSFPTNLNLDGLACATLSFSFETPHRNWFSTVDSNHDNTPIKHGSCHWTSREQKNWWTCGESNS